MGTDSCPQLQERVTTLRIHRGRRPFSGRQGLRGGEGRLAARGFVCGDGEDVPVT